MLNPDGRLWIDRLSGGLEPTGLQIGPRDAERIIRLVAHHVGVEVHAAAPRVSAELPETGERFEGLLPPVAAAPCFSIRRPAVAVFTLDDYASRGVMTASHAEALRAAVETRKNILIAGGTSTGKTTLVNALLAEVAKSADRVVLIEDTRELQCASPNLVALRTKDGAASLTDLVRCALRLRPDRIPIGEVRGPEALDLVKAWGTGHPGGLGTIHAGSAMGALVLEGARVDVREVFEQCSGARVPEREPVGVLADVDGDGPDEGPAGRAEAPGRRGGPVEPAERRTERAGAEKGRRPRLDVVHGDRSRVATVDAGHRWSARDREPGETGRLGAGHPVHEVGLRHERAVAPRLGEVAAAEPLPHDARASRPRQPSSTRSSTSSKPKGPP